MRVYPVIMCGGAGTRLWPASTAACPKQFVPLVGSRSSFEDTLQRVVALEGAQRIVVVAGVAHADLVGAQMGGINVPLTLLLEPQPRDSAAAMAAAAAWIRREDPDGIAVVVSADHHIPDVAAFQAAAATACRQAMHGDIVTLGVRPGSASTAYGYIRPSGPGPIHRVDAFVEKPDARTAGRYVRDGYLWNSGNFVVRATVLLEELAACEPAVLDAASRSVSSATVSGDVVSLGPEFLTSPRISIDYAVMERTRRAAVLPVDFQWSDLGAWDAIWEASRKDDDGNVALGGSILVGSSNLYVRSCPEVRIAAVGLKEIAIVAEGGSVLVCALDAAQAVKEAALIAGRPAAPDLRERAAALQRWLFGSALPIWWCYGADRRGGFHEALDEVGAPVETFRRARVQCRQAFTYARATRLGWRGPGREAAAHGWSYFADRYSRSDGLFRTMVSPNGAPLDDTPFLYDQAFALLALSELYALGGAEWARDEAKALLAALGSLRHGAGGYRESGAHPFQSNAHMHLLEASLAWMAQGVPEFEPVAAQVIDLATTRFIDENRGCLREFFDADWRPAQGDAGRLVEPGHQFEWAWLFARWAKGWGDGRSAEAARRLFDAGCRGLDPVRGVAVNALWDDFTVQDPAARLWPQTEYLKAAAILGEDAHVSAAVSALSRYLDTPLSGLWRDRMRPDGGFEAEPAPASSFYHVILACESLSSAMEDPEIGGATEARIAGRRAAVAPG